MHWAVGSRKCAFVRRKRAFVRRQCAVCSECAALCIRRQEFRAVTVTCGLHCALWAEEDWPPIFPQHHVAEAGTRLRQ